MPLSDGRAANCPEEYRITDRDFYAEDLRGTGRNKGIQLLKRQSLGCWDKIHRH